MGAQSQTPESFKDVTQGELVVQFCCSCFGRYKFAAHVWVMKWHY